MKVHRILIIEDEEDIRDCLCDVLETEGYSVTSAKNGKDAVQVLSHEPKPDLILLDLMMPVMSGEEFIAHDKIHGFAKDVPIIIMSADMQTERKAGLLGVKGHVKKPLELDDLISAVKDCCR